MRVGQGFDVHRLVSGRPLLLAGVEIPHERGLAGHSDADVLAHAVGDALLGALAVGDLGQLFPSSDPRCAGASGAALLAPILDRVREAGYLILNVDTTVIAQEPVLAPFAAQMRKGLAEMLRIPEQRVSGKLKSSDRLGAIGAGEGIAAQAVVLLDEVAP